MAISRRSLMTGLGAATAGVFLAPAPSALAAAPMSTGALAAAAAAALPVTSRNSIYTRKGVGPLYWNIYGWSFPHNAPIPEAEWQANIDWLAADFAPSGYKMACTDGWGACTSFTANGYRTTFDDEWQHDWSYWVNYLAARGMTLGVYHNPLWVHANVVADPSYTVVGRPDIKVADITVPGDIFGKDVGFNDQYWVDVTKPGAKEYVQGYVNHFKNLGVTYLRIDFLSWYETGTDAGVGTVGTSHGSADYETALQWMHEAAGDGIELSLVMPHLFNDARNEIKYGDMVRINADADSGGWARLSGGRQSWQDAWPNWFNPFCGFTGWAHRSGRGQLILDGDFLMMNTFADDDERRTAISLMTVAGSPLAISDLHSNIGGNGWVYTNPEVLDIHNKGLVGKPVFYSGTPYSQDGTSRDTERWAGQLPDGSWVVALFNRNDTSTVTRTIDFAGHLGISGPASVRDLWARTDLGSDTSVSAALAPHACKLVKVVPQSATKRYHAAFAAWGGGANFNNNHAGYAGMGFVDKLEAGSEGPTVTFAVQAPSAGSFTIGYRYANATGGTGTMTVSAQKENRTQVSGPFQVSLPALADWDTWGTVTGSIQLAAGVNLITIGRTGSDTGAINLNYIELNV
ncbi:carbohydrate-binding protein [Streptomyces sp. NBC_00316]|uniref:carbohydrate-binding protein n=1 Tax=Streptomyces sp. NBC_00316 TaxID=2975710 RepID=UPI002E2A47DC|nr:carbohydrate-binding protein [Streptomyces sp. NBC_00316]